MIQSAQQLFSHLQNSLAAMCRRAAGEEANATVELAVAFSFLLTPIMLATTATAFMIYDSIEVSNAAHAGAMYGMISSTLAGDTAGITKAAQAEAGDFGANLTVTPTVYYACSAAINGTKYSTQSAAASACPANASNHYLQFVQVATSTTVDSPVKVPGMPGSFTLHGLSVMEVQE